jgi:hypothetical protein
MAMATTRMNGPKGAKLPPRIYGPLGPLALKPQQNCQEGQSLPPQTLAPFRISAPVRDKRAKRAKICGGPLTSTWPPCSCLGRAEWINAIVATALMRSDCGPSGKLVNFCGRSRMQRARGAPAIISSGRAIRPTLVERGINPKAGFGLAVPRRRTGGGSNPWARSGAATALRGRATKISWFDCLIIM